MEYKPVQKKNSSWTPAKVQKKGKSPAKMGHFSIQPKPNQTSAPPQEIGDYSRASADRLAANVMRGLQAKEQEQAEESTVQRKSESPWTARFDVAPPTTQTPTPQMGTAFAPVSENPIQRQCADCAKEEKEQAGEAGKDLEEIGIQTKLTIGAPGDAYEQEADRVASQVISMSAPPDSSASVQRRLDTNNPNQIWQRAQSITPVVQRLIDPRVQMGQMIQRAAQIDGNQASGDLESRLNASKGGGSPLSEGVRGFMEPRFGADFSGVRVHTGGEAVQMNQELGAQAFTHGSDVYFGAGKSPGNNELTAHELTHVVHQTGVVQRNLEIGEKGTPQEKGIQPHIQPLYSPFSSLIQRDIKGKGDVPLGEFEIDMKKKENPGGKSGENGVVKFTPDKNKGRNTNDIRLSQIVKTLDLGTNKDFDWSKVPGEENRNKMMTKDSGKVHVTKFGDTLKSLARNYYGDPNRHAEIYNDPENKKVLKLADPDANIPKGTTIKIPKAVEGGYFIDHLAGDARATPRANKADANVPQDYVWPGEEIPVKNEHGFKKPKAIKTASLKDFPGTGGALHFNFETVARSVDLGIYYGTIHWDFEVKNDKVSQEAFHITPGVSDTFEEALDEFNKFYKNQHVVMKGETLSSISQKYYGTPNKWNEIFKANKNKIKDPNHIEPGWQLNIPGVSGGV
ncbi:MAG: DUF4157 domain-containing protein [Coleofasciculus sp. G1-WW12-02]|uniref:eCIS core domain-containing protein n=1 Tax=Coleofasciculus sp. G1-WW12-02 TaxID=3068483 RepID=UPI0032F44D23